MTDIVERLRARSEAAQTTRRNSVHTPRVTLQEAADTITTLRTALAAAEEGAEKAEGELIDQRDAAEQAFSQAYYLVVGRSPEWSNLFGANEALEEMDDAQRLLRGAVKRAESLVARFVEACGPFVASYLHAKEVALHPMAVLRRAQGGSSLEDFRALASLTAEAKGE